MPYVKNSANSRKRSKRSRGRKRLAGAVFLVLIAALLLFALRSHGHAAAVVPAPRPEAASAAVAHRTPAPPWNAGARGELQNAIRSALAPGTRDAARWSCVVLAQDGTVLYDDRGSNAVAPASVQKSIVSDASLTEFGMHHRFDTLFAAAQQPDGGTLHGDLYVAGSGDPSLRSEDLNAAIAALRKAGLSTIDGGVIVDPSALHGEEINPLWNADDANEDFMAATSGISLDEDTAEFHVTGTQPGEPALVTVVPASRDVRTYGSVTTGGGDDVIIAATETPNLFRLAGNVPPGVEEKFWLPVHGIPQYAGDVIDGLLARDGVSVARDAATGTAPVDAQILWDHRSKPLPVLLKHMLIFSDNHFAEQLMRALGGRSGSAATDRTGLLEERRILAEQGIPVPGLHLVDGSGLAHANRVASITLAAHPGAFRCRAGRKRALPAAAARRERRNAAYVPFPCGRRTRSREKRPSRRRGLSGRIRGYEASRQSRIRFHDQRFAGRSRRRNRLGSRSDRRALNARKEIHARSHRRRTAALDRARARRRLCRRILRTPR